MNADSHSCFTSTARFKTETRRTFNQESTSSTSNAFPTFHFVGMHLAARSGVGGGVSLAGSSVGQRRRPAPCRSFHTHKFSFVELCVKRPDHCRSSVAPHCESPGFKNRSDLPQYSYRLFTTSLHMTWKPEMGVWMLRLFLSLIGHR
jgi:hypothetical protein